MSSAAETREFLTRRGCVPVVVDGNSMTPSLRKGQMVLAHRLRPPRVGDVALLEAFGGLIVHRLVARVGAGRGGWYVHMGDAAAECGLAGERDILGLVDAAAPRRAPCARAHALALAFRLGAVLLLLAPTLRGLLRKASFLGRPRCSARSSAS